METSFYNAGKPFVCDSRTSTLHFGPQIVILNEVKNLGSRPVSPNKEILRFAQDDTLHYSSTLREHTMATTFIMHIPSPPQGKIFREKRTWRLLL